MTIDEFPDKVHKDIPTSLNKGTTISLILSIIKKTPEHFKNAINDPQIFKKNLNENDLTQIFVEQLDVQRSKEQLPFGIKNQYSDIFCGTKGIPDFYFHPLEEGRTSPPIFVVEAKRLPAPGKYREQEYVIGYSSNGGIERYKLEIHGKGLFECGLLAFIEFHDFKHWENTVNSWIKDISKSDHNWNESESLKVQEPNSEYQYLCSKAFRVSGDSLKLHHFWIDIQTK